MKCPTCHVMLISAERNGVEIDYCPECWGIWLDRGELNLILDRSQSNRKPMEAGTFVDAPLPSLGAAQAASHGAAH